MSVQLRDRIELQRGKHKRWTTSDHPSSNELSTRQYFHVQRLRQQLRIAESEQIAGRELTGSAESVGARTKYSHRLAVRPCALVFSNRATTRGDDANLSGNFGLGSFTTYQRPGALQPGIVGEKVPSEDFAARSIIEVQIPKGLLLPDGVVSSGSGGATGIIVSIRVLYHRDVKAKRLHRKCFF